MVNKVKKGLVFGTFLVLVFVEFIGISMNVSAEDPPDYVWVDDDYTSSTPGWGTTHFDKIQDGIDAVAEDGTVYVYVGTYYEKVTIPRALTLEGEDNDTTIIQGSGSGNGIYANDVSGITIENLKVQGFSFGIYLYSSSGSTLTGNTVMDWYIGIFLDSSSSSTAIENYVTGSKYGIYLRNSDSNTIIGNTVMVSGNIGIFLDSSSSSIISGNTLMSSTRGIFLYSSSESTLIGNTVTVGDYGISLDNSGSSTLTGNTVTDGEYGIYLFNSGSNMLMNNAMTDNTYNFGVYGTTLAHYTQDIDTSNTVDGKPIYYWVGHGHETVPSDAGFVGVINSNHITVQDLTLANNYEGVLFAYTTDSTIQNVVVTDDIYGIKLYYSASNTLTGNTVTGSSTGIRLDYSNSVTLTLNTVTDSTIGIYLRSSGSSTVSRNAISVSSMYPSYTYGIYLYSSAGSTLTGNMVTGGNYGIRLYNSGNNILTKNTVMDNYYSIYLSSSNGNSIYYNSFIGNTIQLYSSSSKNVWDDGDGNGNYWSDYEGVDDGSCSRVAGDGIGDTLIPHQTVDYYPLMEPWGPKYEIRELIEDIYDMDLPEGIENSLVAKLEDALNLLEKENLKGAVQKLGDFIDYAKAQRGKKLTEAQADILIEIAQQIIDNI